MAQMIAKVLAKNPTGKNKAELEKHADKVKWAGELHYLYWNNHEKDNNNNGNSGGNANINTTFNSDTSANYWDVQANYSGERGFIGIGYRNFKGDGFKNLSNYSNDNAEDSA